MRNKELIAFILYLFIKILAKVNRKKCTICHQQFLTGPFYLKGFRIGKEFSIRIFTMQFFLL